MAKGSGPCLCVGCDGDNCCAALNGPGQKCGCPVKKAGWLMKLNRCRTCACWDCDMGVDDCNCKTRRSGDPEPPPPPLPRARWQPYAWVPASAPQVDVVTGHLTDRSKDSIAALQMIDKDTASQIRLSFIAQMNSTFLEQENLIEELREEVRRLTQELSKVQPIRYD